MDLPALTRMLVRLLGLWLLIEAVVIFASTYVQVLGTPFGGPSWFDQGLGPTLHQVYRFGIGPGLQLAAGVWLVTRHRRIADWLLKD